MGGSARGKKDLLGGEAEAATEDLINLENCGREGGKGGRLKPDADDERRIDPTLCVPDKGIHRFRQKGVNSNSSILCTYDPMPYQRNKCFSLESKTSIGESHSL